jgi:hypothetical protein
VAVRPENTIATADGAVACGDGFGRRLEHPTNATAVTFSFHLAKPFFLATYQSTRLTSRILRQLLALR